MAKNSYIPVSVEGVQGTIRCGGCFNVSCLVLAIIIPGLQPYPPPVTCVAKNSCIPVYVEKVREGFLLTE